MTVERGQKYNLNTFDTPQNKELNFQEFSMDEEYRKVNREFLKQVVDELPQDNFMHLDIAAGTFLAASEMQKMCIEQGKKGTIVCYEPDDFALGQGRSNVSSRDGVNIVAIRGVGEELPFKTRSFDSVSFLDAIHEVKGVANKRQALSEVNRVVKEDKLFVVNSAFTTEANGDDDYKYGSWIAHALRDSGAKGRKDAEKMDQDDTIKTHTPEEYDEMIIRAGFKTSLSRVKIKLSASALKAISKYPNFDKGILDKAVPLKEDGQMPDPNRISSSLIKIIDQRNISGLDRVWINFTARKVTPHRQTIVL